MKHNIQFAKVNGHFGTTCPSCGSRSVLPNQDGCYQVPYVWINEKARCLSCNYVEMVAPDGYEEEFTSSYWGRKITEPHVISSPYVLNSGIRFDTIMGEESLYLIVQKYKMTGPDAIGILLTRYWCETAQGRGWVREQNLATLFKRDMANDTNVRLSLKMRNFQ